MHCNAVNHGFDPFALLDRVPMNRVIEIHIAGGSSKDGFWMDAHNGRVAHRVWDLLEYVLPRAHNVRGVLFEMLDEFAPRLGVDAIGEELERARNLWTRCRAA